MPSRLSIYNGALRACGERGLANLTENREPRRLLDAVWVDGGIRACLEMGYWNFATRTRQMEYDPNITPGFGYQHAFQKPDDWVKTVSICCDEFFNSPITRYSDEAGYWFTGQQTIYVQYVSDDVLYGSNLAAFPKSFTSFVEYYFASQIIASLTHSDATEQKIMAGLMQSKRVAQGTDAMNQPTKHLPPGGWVSARHGSDSYPWHITG